MWSLKYKAVSSQWGEKRKEKKTAERIIWMMKPLLAEDLHF